MEISGKQIYVDIVSNTPTFMGMNFIQDIPSWTHIGITWQKSWIANKKLIDKGIPLATKFSYAWKSTIKKKTTTIW